MTPIRRLTLAGVGVIAGGMVVAIGTRIAWATATLHAPPVQPPGLPRIVLAGGSFSMDAATVGAGYLFGLGLLIALVPLGWLVAGARARIVLAALVVIVAAFVVTGTVRTRGDLLARARPIAERNVAIPERTTLRISSAPGITVTAAGAVLAALAAVAGGAAGRHVPRLGLPERPPGPPEGNGRR